MVTFGLLLTKVVSYHSFDLGSPPNKKNGWCPFKATKPGANFLGAVGLLTFGFRPRGRSCIGVEGRLARP